MLLCADANLISRIVLAAIALRNFFLTFGDKVAILFFLTDIEPLPYLQWRAGKFVMSFRNSDLLTFAVPELCRSRRTRGRLVDLMFRGDIVSS